MTSIVRIFSPVISIISAYRAPPPGATTIPGVPFRSIGVANRVRAVKARAPLATALDPRASTGLRSGAGTGPFYAVLAFLTVIAGICMYLANEGYERATASNAWATLGVGLAIVALLLGVSANRIVERKWINVVKSAQGFERTDQGTGMAAVLAKAEKINIVTTIVLGLALICVVLSRTVTSNL